VSIRHFKLPRLTPHLLPLSIFFVFSTPNRPQSGQGAGKRQIHPHYGTTPLLRRSEQAPSADPPSTLRRLCFPSSLLPRFVASLRSPSQFLLHACVWVPMVLDGSGIGTSASPLAPAPRPTRTHTTTTTTTGGEALGFIYLFKSC
jgi:hypothetical protein